MADEITVLARIDVTNGSFTDDRYSGRISIDQATQGAQGGIQIIGTSYEAIATGDVSAEGYCYLRNLDDENFVDVGTDGGAALVPFLRLMPGEVALFRASTAALYAQADTAACKVDVLLLDA